MNKADLRLDWCSHEAAKYAVEHWHYSRTMPIGKLVKIGVWENGVFIGAVIFSTGASPQLHKTFSVTRFQVCELVRVALTSHRSAVSRIVSIALMFLRRSCPGLRLVVSFADPEHRHHGGIYQAGNWVYCGRSSDGLYYRLADGTVTHNRNLQGPKGFMGKPTVAAQAAFTKRLRDGIEAGSIVPIRTAPKFKYVMPLDAAMRAQIAPLAKPYPKCVRSLENEAPGTTRRGRCDSDPDAPPSVVQL